MKYRRVGNSGLKVSVIALGGWITFEELRQSGVREVTRMAADHGINYFDLADEYGKGAAEELFGNLMRDFRREDLVLSSKAYWPMSEDPNDRGLSRKHLLQSIETSLHRLNTDYVDIYYCHRHDPETPVEETVRAMDHIIRQGKALYWGVSMWPAALIDQAVTIARQLGCYAPIVEQPRYSLVDRGMEADILPVARRHGLGLAVYSPLGQGVLTGKYNDGIPPGSRADVNEWARSQITEPQIALARRLAPIADGLGVPLAHLALAWTLHLPEVCCAIMGATTREQVEDNSRAGDLELSPDTLAAIDAALAASG